MWSLRMARTQLAPGQAVITQTDGDLSRVGYHQGSTCVSHVQRKHHLLQGSDIFARSVQPGAALQPPRHGTHKSKGNSGTLVGGNRVNKEQRKSAVS